MKRLTIILLTLLAIVLPKVQAQHLEAELGDSSFVSLLTCGPGEEYYTTWGHSAIRVCDPELNLDLVYNWGTFNFNTKNFYLKFCQGRLDYCISRGTYHNFIAEYDWEGRAVWEQRFNLTKQERNNLFLLIEENYLPENRFYKYDFFRDNCATRVRDIINNSLCHRTAFVEYMPETEITYRDMLRIPTETYQLWWRLGVDIVLGQRCDKVCNSMEYMFSPMEMMNQLDTTTIKTKNAKGEYVSTGELLMGEKAQILSETKEPFKPSLNPTRCFWLLFIVVLALTIIAWAKGKKLVWLDEILLWLVNICSLVILFLWFGSDHYCTKFNWNLLWANPLFIYIAIRLRKSNIVVLLFTMFCLVVLMAGFWFLPQTFNPAIYPIALTLMIRLIDKIRPIINKK